jgi:hypothetical protein
MNFKQVISNVEELMNQFEDEEFEEFDLLIALVYKFAQWKTRLEELLNQRAHDEEDTEDTNTEEETMQ